MLRYKTFILCLCAAALAACSQQREALSVTVTNPTELERTGEMVELPMNQIAALLQLNDTAQVVVLDAKGEQLPTQLTYDGKLIFPATVGPMGKTAYSVQTGTPAEVTHTTGGRRYHEHSDDLAWENDVVAFRAFGPARAAKGQHWGGYNIIGKRGTNQPILEDVVYADSMSVAAYDSLGVYGSFCQQPDVSLGAGATALVADKNELALPDCYTECEVLDDGPLRFTAVLRYAPRTVGTDSMVVETRVIALDHGSRLNRTAVSYSNLKQSRTLAAGFVLHEEPNELSVDVEQGYIAGEEHPETPVEGRVMMGCVFPTRLDDAVEMRYTAAQRSQAPSIYGHVLARAAYEPGSEFVYYWGYGCPWNGGMHDFEMWEKYLQEFARKVRQPLVVEMR